ncbi:MAG: hypothetical protein JWQ03_1029 [Variovorax sp.]|nr:hypothetical protein [Variovorax sp.]
MDDNFRQSAVLFGSDRSLVGIVTEPLCEKPAGVACLLLNMGAHHRVGPHRVNVKLAHHLASLGIGSLRFDLAGLGDSKAATGAEHFAAQAVRDLQAAMDLLEQTLGIRQFLVVGLCSGATNALAAAVADARVVGITLFDGYSFPGRRSRWERQLQRALAASSNPAILGKTLRWLKRGGKALDTRDKAAGIFDEVQSPEVVAGLFCRSMEQVVERGVAVYLLYSGTLHVRDRNRDQLGPFRNEPFAKHIHYEFMADIDHTLTTMASQQRFLKSVSDWALDVVTARLAPPAIDPVAPTSAVATNTATAASGVAATATTSRCERASSPAALAH